MCTCVPLIVDNMATAVWVWDMQRMSLEAVLEHRSAVRCFQWDPRKPRLALCTGNTKLYLWSPAGCVSVQVPTEGNDLCRHELDPPSSWNTELHYYLLTHSIGTVIVMSFLLGLCAMRRNQQM